MAMLQGSDSLVMVVVGTRTTRRQFKSIHINQPKNDKDNNDKDGGRVVTMTGPPAYLTADCEAAMPSMSQVDGGGNTLSKK